MTANTSEAMSQQQQDAHELDLQLNELTSKEHIVQIETQGKIDVAQIEADTERIKAALELEGLQTTEVTKRIEAMYAFESDAVIAEADKVSAAFESMGTSISSVSDSLDGFTNLYSDVLTSGDDIDKMDAGNWIDTMLSQQQQLVDAQTALADSQTRLAELKYEKLASGEALIKIDSSGLEPALEQVLWSIMEKVQLKVAMEEAELLLGLGTKVTP
jgi:predicted SPOUT superfamily RNA methylase MTH1